ncbi:MAG: hypothetical protein KAU95_03825 [Candidatus Aenigmarchaeota archaeon]|nr:hypothetical protein [Candidatus Aenigmarchaeota archaeon]
MTNIINQVKKQKKRGAPEGHAGATRETPIPDRVVELKPKVCPYAEVKKFKSQKDAAFYSKQTRAAQFHKLG